MGTRASVACISIVLAAAWSELACSATDRSGISGSSEKPWSDSGRSGQTSGRPSASGSSDASAHAGSSEPTAGRGDAFVDTAGATGVVDGGAGPGHRDSGTGEVSGRTDAGDESLAIAEGPLTLWYDKPAAVWNEALPIGNGRLGAMVFGEPAAERLQLNESSLWSGGPSRNDNPRAKSVLGQVRQLIFTGRYKEAETLINANMTASQMHGAKYQPVGNLSLRFPGHATYTAYRRELDLKRAVHRTTYRVGDVTYTREAFASQPDQVVVVRLTADRPGSLSFGVGIDGPLKNGMTVVDANTLELTGTSSSHEGVTGQVKFNARVKILNTGGTTAKATSGVQVSDADQVVLLVSVGTNFVDYKTLTGDAAATSTRHLVAAEGKAYDDLLKAHVTSYRQYFERVALDLGASTPSATTVQRVRSFRTSNDRQLAALYFQFGRYLLIAGSQPGGQPLNLQGIWNDNTSPSWDSKYTININTEMNYWPAERTNLSELHEPLFRLIGELAESGRQTASSMYGADGWVAHHNTDIWRIAGVVDGAYWGMWPMGAAWLTQHLWEHYLYTGDRAFLEAVYPTMKSAAEFFQDFLTEEPKHKWLVVAPSISPENEPAGHGTTVVAGATMDNQLVFDLFTRTIEAASIVGRDDVFAGQLKALLNRLPPMQVGRFGQLQEWMEDWDNPNDQHRHVSHLYGLFPSNQISPRAHPQLFDAARTTLIRRGDVSTGWSMGWKVNFWARLLDGNHALKLIREQLTLVDPVSGTSGGTYPNLFDAHPPFQIDGNFGCTSGIAEMLLQTHDGAVHILPALPDDWAETGGVKGLRAYGGFTVDFAWSSGQLDKLIVHSNLGGTCRIRVSNELTSADGSRLSPATGPNDNPFFATPTIPPPRVSASAKLNPVVLERIYEYDLRTEPGQSYTLSKKR